jgi:hypothetical protein
MCVCAPKQRFRTLYGNRQGMTQIGASINATLNMISTQVRGGTHGHIHTSSQAYEGPDSSSSPPPQVEPIVDNAAATIGTLGTQLVPVKTTVVSVVRTYVCLHAFVYMYVCMCVCSSGLPPPLLPMQSPPSSPPSPPPHTPRSTWRWA